MHGGVVEEERNRLQTGGDENNFVSTVVAGRNGVREGKEVAAAL